MSSQSWIAGLGIISAIGNNLHQNLESLEAERAGIGDMEWLASALSKELPVGEVKSSNAELARTSALSPKFPRTALLSCMAAAEALDDAGWEKNNSLRTGFISANTVGGMDKTEDFYRFFSVIRLRAGSLMLYITNVALLRSWLPTIWASVIL